MNTKLKNVLKKIKPLYDFQHAIRVYYNTLQEKHKVASYKKHGESILREISLLTIKNGLHCACIEGTLLGLVRDKRIIPWDDDLDFVIVRDEEFCWNTFERIMTGAGFWKYREIEEDGKIVMESYKKRGVLCDFNLWEATDSEIIVQYGIYQIPGEQYENGQIARYQVWDLRVPAITDIHKEMISGIEVCIPDNSEDILKALYGEGWRIPDAHYEVKRKEYAREYRIIYFRKPFLRIGHL